ncbi:MAG: formylglycine-generating enzyme family protein [Spirochaetales bacterium]|nr:formylglycine-generating enzyme family protein [Spirochaetales bacterium]
MKEDKKITQADIDSAKVQLGPLWGIPVRVYLPVAYAALFFLLLFLILVLPGMRKYGSYLVFEGKPSPAAIYSEGDYKGSSGQRIFFPAGTYTLHIEHEGFVSRDLELKVPGRLLGSLFFPRRQTVSFGLNTQDPAAYLQTAFAEHSSWALSGKPSALYQIPAVISEAVLNLALTGALQSKDEPEASQTAADSGLPTDLDFARELAAASASAESARDGLRASVGYTSSGIVSPLSLADSVRIITVALGSSPGFAAYAKELIPGAAQKISAALGSRQAAPSEGTAVLPKAQGKKNLAGQEFVLFTPGSIEMGGEAPSGSLLPYTKALPAFGLAASEVTNRQWARFLDENPEWAPANKAALIEEGMVDEDYLSAWKGPDDLPLTGISWFAATAYCDWLSAGSEKYRFGLPNEAMWEAAAKSGMRDADNLAKPGGIWSDGKRSGPERPGSAGVDASGIADIFGNVWEWSSDSYLPYPAFSAGIFQSAERSVRGGSWANKQGSVGLNSRGGLEPSCCTPYLGFRPALLTP